MSMTEPSRNGSEASTISAESNGDMDLRAMLATVRNNWIAVVVCALLGATVVFAFERRKSDTYTAEVLLQRQADRSPIESLSPAIVASGQDGLTSQIELLRGRTVLRSVVDELGLRLSLVDRESHRTELLDDIKIEPNAQAGSYRAELSGVGYAIVEVGSGRAVGKGGRDGFVEGPGFRFRLRRLAQQLDFNISDAQGAINRLRRQLRPEQIRNTNLIRVRYSHADPELAAQVLNSLAAAYQKQSAQRNRESAIRKREFISKRLIEVADSLAESQGALSSYQEQTATLDPKIEGQALASQAMGLETEVRNYRFQESILQSLLVSLRADNNDDDALRRIVAISGDLLPAGVELYRRLEQAQDERRRLTSSRLGYQQGAVRVETADSVISATKAEIRGVTEHTLSLLRDKRQDAEKRLADLQRAVGALPARASAYTQLQQRVDAVQKIFDMLAQRYYEAQIAEAVEAAMVEVVDPALVPASPDPANRGRNIMAGFVLGLMIGIVGALIRENLDLSVRHAGDAEKVTGLKVLAMVPKLRRHSSNGRRHAVVIDKNNPTAEAFNMLRTTLRFVRVDRPRVIAVSSAAPGEGKSMLSVNLATTFARGGQKVLLIDADLRRPTVHAAFGLRRAPGLTDLLIGDVTLVDAVQRVADSSVDVLTCGTNSPSPAELLGTVTFTSLLSSLREVYDTIIIDTAPILAVADTLVLAPNVDGLLVVTHYATTNRVALAKAVEQLYQVRAPILGIVMNQVPSTPRYGRYGGNSNYYTSYYGKYESQDGGEA